jgi:hypothetical protein
MSKAPPSRPAATAELQSLLVFCCFNKNAKLTPEFFDVWMRLLARVEGSVLWLLAQDDATAENLRREAKARGVAPGRVVFAPPIATRTISRATAWRICSSIRSPSTPARRRATRYGWGCRCSPAPAKRLHHAWRAAC